MHITFLEFPPISESVKSGEPYYWNTLELHHSYQVVDTYEKVKDNGKSEHFLLLVDKDRKLVEVPVRDNIKVNYVG